MPSTTTKQARTMAAAAHNPAFGMKMGIPQHVAQDFNKADKGKGMIHMADGGSVLLRMFGGQQQGYGGVSKQEEEAGAGATYPVAGSAPQQAPAQAPQPAVGDTTTDADQQTPPRMMTYEQAHAATQAHNLLLQQEARTAAARAAQTPARRTVFSDTYANGGLVRKNMASGGEVSGPGTGTSDSVPAMLSDGEYVMPADTVSKVGIPKLDAIKDATHRPVAGAKSGKMGGMIKKANGGYVATPPPNQPNPLNPAPQPGIDNQVATNAMATVGRAQQLMNTEGIGGLAEARQLMRGGQVLNQETAPIVSGQYHLAGMKAFAGRSVPVMDAGGNYQGSFAEAGPNQGVYTPNQPTYAEGATGKDRAGNAAVYRGGQWMPAQ